MGWSLGDSWSWLIKITIFGKGEGGNVLYLTKGEKSAIKKIGNPIKHIIINLTTTVLSPEKGKLSIISAV